MYDNNKKSQFDHKRDAPAPFATTKDRTCTEKMNNNPGAGTYKQKMDKIVPKVSDKMHNSFSTNIARFCPTAPGSGLVQGPSWF